MTRRFNCSVPDKKGEWLDDHEQLSPSGLLEWAIDEHMNAQGPLGNASNLEGNDDIIRDAKTVLQQADRQYRHYTMNGESAKMAALEAAGHVVENNDYSLPQLFYFSEAILADGPELSRHLVSDHLIEDAGHDPYAIAAELLQNVLRAYLERVKLEEPVNEPEPRPPGGTPPALESGSSMQTVVMQVTSGIISPGGTTEADDWDAAHDLKEEAQDALRDRTNDWSWTEKAEIIEHLIEEENVTLDIPSEQLRDGPEIDEHVGQLLYWAFDAYLDDRLEYGE